MSEQRKNIDKQPLITPGFVMKLTVTVGVLLLITIGIYFGGNYWSKSISQGGHTLSETLHKIVIGQVTLNTKANNIRFAEQRRDGVTKRLSLYFNWPEFSGYSEQTKRDFNEIGEDPNLIFVDITRADGQMDMSLRFNPIYRNFISSPPIGGPEGLIYYKMDNKSNFSGELIYTESVIKERPFVIKCLSDTDQDSPSTTECQRDINIVGDLTITYRYSDHLLPEWKAIEEKLLQYLKQNITLN